MAAISIMTKTQYMENGAREPIIYQNTEDPLNPSKELSTILENTEVQKRI